MLIIYTLFEGINTVLVSFYSQMPESLFLFTESSSGLEMLSRYIHCTL